MKTLQYSWLYEYYLKTFIEHPENSTAPELITSANLKLSKL